MREISICSAVSSVGVPAFPPAELLESRGNAVDDVDVHVQEKLGKTHMHKDEDAASQKMRKRFFGRLPKAKPPKLGRNFFFHQRKMSPLEKPLAATDRAAVVRTVTRFLSNGAPELETLGHPGFVSASASVVSVLGAAIGVGECVRGERKEVCRKGKKGDPTDMLMSPRAGCTRKRNAVSSESWRSRARASTTTGF